MIKEILSLLPEGSNCENEALQLTKELLKDGAKVRTLLSEQEELTARHIKEKRQTLLQQRSQLYKSPTPPNPSDLRRISRELREKEDHSVVDQALLDSIQVKVQKLQELVGPKLLPWRLRYVTDVDPEQQDAIIELGGGAILDSRGRNAWADYCDICDLEVPDKQARWRCFSCKSVECPECHEIWDSHSNCCPGMIMEYSHPVFMRLKVSAKSLSCTIANMFQVWSKRPCFAVGGDYGNWLTYEQVFDRIQKISTILNQSGASKTMICFPAGSIDFYLADLACVLAGITSIGLPIPLPTTLPPCDLVICEKQMQSELALPEATKFLNIAEDACSKVDGFHVPTDRQDSSDSLYTIFYTSGSTGTPKAIPISRQTWMQDFTVSEDCIPGCWFSFLPPCWATDRLVVYQALYNGYRVGFSRREPSLEEIVEDLSQLEPTALVAPPALLQFMSTLEPPPSLGTRLRYVGCGGASIGESVKNWVAETYGVPCFEAYGITECGGIASDGKVVPKVVDSLKIKDTTTGDWLDPRLEESVVGELWVDGFNTKDLVELSENGTKLRVLGRSDEAVSFKTENGKWCSLIDIEQEIMRTCSPDLVQQAIVVRNSQNIIVLVVQTSIDMEEWLLYQEIRKRVTVPFANFPQAILITEEAFPVTNTYKIKRSAVIQKCRKAVEQVRPMDALNESGQDALAIASKILGHQVDPSRSFLENGGDSVLAIRWLKEMKLYYHGNPPDWRSMLNDPLGGSTLRTEEEFVSMTVEPAIRDPTARHILLTGATGFLGRHVLAELLKQHIDKIVVCLVRPQSMNKLTATVRVKVFTEVPLDLAYCRVIHLAAKVDHIQDYLSLKEANVTLTEQLLCLRLAPMLYCSTSSTRQGQPPFQDGYTQSKWISEQMVLRSGGTCVWPPFLVWGNPKDWLTRLIKHCVATATYPAELGFLPCSPVEICAKELVSGGPCTAWDLDLSELFLLIKMETPMRPISFASFKSNASRDPSCALYPVLPLLQGSQVGLPRSPQLKLLPLNAKDINDMLRHLK